MAFLFVSHAVSASIACRIWQIRAELVFTLPFTARFNRFRPLLHDMPGLQFVVTTGVAQFNVEDRKLIRSHVMKGKNLGRMRPLGSRFRRASPVAATQLDNPRRDSSSSPSLLSDSSSPRSSESSASTTPSACSDQSSPIDVEAALHISNPRNFGSLTSAVTFAESVKPETMDIVLQCTL